MCEFASRIVDKDGKVHFLTDEDVIAYCADKPEPIEWQDFVGHSAIEKVLKVDGEHVELFPCGPEYTQAIKSGAVRRIMNAYGWTSCHVTNDGQLHREDGPAIEQANGNKWWYRNGQQHREDGPAIEWADGDKWWYRNGQRHREDGPAVERANGDKLWYLNGRLHREDGPAVEEANSSKEWYRNGVECTP